MLTDSKLKRERICKRIAQELEDNSLVNLGIGMPTLVANYIPKDKTILLHSENGFTGLIPAENHDHPDMDIVNAGGAPVSIAKGGVFFDSLTSFSIIRGGHLHTTVLGALEVDQKGNLANYKIPGKMVPGMGGAMDLVVGARKVIIAMEHLNKKGESKILKKCSLPLTAKGEVDLIVTDLAVMRVTREGLLLEEIAIDTTVEEVRAHTDADLIVSENMKVFG
ncbi:MAG: 3-oxoacid CoA-transferase subunit B [Myxococcales bacterium]|jgi:acetate CoA/acetoacetate CoA-transferase beta subunit|nr:3-oxoacid CoA-transferase subunit B [Myxococcales bacterium]